MSGKLADTAACAGHQIKLAAAAMLMKTPHCGIEVLLLKKQEGSLVRVKITKKSNQGRRLLFTQLS